MTMWNAPSDLDYQDCFDWDEPEPDEPEEFEEPPEWADADIPEPQNRDYYEELKGDMDYDLMVEDQILAEEQGVA
jgi:hypothetical protein